MKRIITISLLALLLCTTCIGFVACNNNPQECSLTHFEPWLKEINIDEIVEISIKYDNGSIAPTVDRPIRYTSDKEEIERLVTIWKNVTLTKIQKRGPEPGNGIRTYTFYMEDGATYSFGSTHDSDGDCYYIDNMYYLMSDSPQIATDKVTREETWRPADINNGKQYAITDLMPWLNELSAEDLDEITNDHYGLSLDGIRCTSDTQEIDRLLSEWREVILTQMRDIEKDNCDTIEHTFAIKGKGHQEISTFVYEDGEKWIEIKGDMYIVSNIPLISQDKVTREE